MPAADDGNCEYESSTSIAELSGRHPGRAARAHLIDGPRKPLPPELVDLGTDQRWQLVPQSQLEDVVSERGIPRQNRAMGIGADHGAGDRTSVPSLQLPMPISTVASGLTPDPEP